MAYSGTGIVKPPGGAIRLIGMVCVFTSRGGPKIVQVGKPVEATSGLNRGCVLIGWAGKLFAARLRTRGNMWNGPYGKAIRARNPSGRGAMTTEPLEQQAFGHEFLDASLKTTFRAQVARGPRNPV